jgi:NAD+ synthase
MGLPDSTPASPPAVANIQLAQLNCVVGDIDGNSARIIDAARKATTNGAELLVLPELAVVGYPPEDLILSPDFRARAMQAAHRIAQETRELCALLLGCVWEEYGKIYNAALLIDGGEIIAQHRKLRLPNYGVFDEKRLFSPGHALQVLHWRGKRLGVLICEDVWDDALPRTLGKEGADAVVVLNASPFEAGKHAQRLEIAATAARAAGAPLYYTNLVGGQDDIVFDGGSFVLDSSGTVLHHGPRFAEAIVDSTHAPQKQEAPEAELWGAMVLALRDYVRKNGFSRVLLGLSGGIDSALTAAAACDALGPENVLGVLLPSPYSSKGSIDDALESARLLGMQTRTLPITPHMDSFAQHLGESLTTKDWMENPAVGGNLQARLRGITLMAISNDTGALLLSTGNKSEIAVGYSTLYGDSCGSYNVLKDAYKTQVYAIANWRNQQGRVVPQASIEKPPSAELRPDQRDDEQLPPYDVLDAVLRHHIEGRLSEGEIIALGFDHETVRKVLRLVRISEYKRRQSCPGVKLSAMAFGKDRRYPLTTKY